MDVSAAEISGVKSCRADSKHPWKGLIPWRSSISYIPQTRELEYLPKKKSFLPIALSTLPHFNASF
jgi:hypothetical protein